MSNIQIPDKQTSLSNKPKVAIIGASYAGLTLGNILNKHSIPFTIFESLPNYYDTTATATATTTSTGTNYNKSNKKLSRLKKNLFIIGPFILPSFEYIRQELGLRLTRTIGDDDDTSNDNSNDMKNGTDADNIDDCYERSDVMLALLHNIQDRIQYDSTITAIIHHRQQLQQQQHQQSLFYCSSSTSSESNDNDNATNKSNNNINNNNSNHNHGPFEYIVAADGVHSVLGTNHQMNDDNKILLIGDARWVNDSWYDFGTYRVNKGADIAMSDSIELGMILNTLLNDGEECCQQGSVAAAEEVIGKDDGSGPKLGVLDHNNDPTYNYKYNDPSSIKTFLKQKYSANEKFKLRRKKRLIRKVLFVVLIAFLIEKFRSGCSSNVTQ